ncbi:MAG: hypothetical protein KKC18_04125 [Chloroflexi bacterium]|nr:hypothetical protein [Chloroflexota bacterium]
MPVRWPCQNQPVNPIPSRQELAQGCVTTMATSVGARICYQIDRDGDIYKEIYNQRTATERINAQVKELGIGRPRLPERAYVLFQSLGRDSVFSSTPQPNIHIKSSRSFNPSVGGFDQ